MAVFESLLVGLYKAKRELEAQLAGVRAAILSLTESGRLGEGFKPRGRPRRSTNKPKGIIVGGRKRKRRKLSAEARKAISDAQRARWAKQKAGARRKRPARSEPR
jgi:hypothetical protein